MAVAPFHSVDPLCWGADPLTRRSFPAQRDGLLVVLLFRSPLMVDSLARHGVSSFPLKSRPKNQQAQQVDREQSDFSNVHCLLTGTSRTLAKFVSIHAARVGGDRKLCQNPKNRRRLNHNPTPFRMSSAFSEGGQRLDYHRLAESPLSHVKRDVSGESLVG